MPRRRVAALLAVPLVGAAVVLGLWLLAPCSLPWSLLHRAALSKGDLLVSRLEAYRREHGGLPGPRDGDVLLPLGFLPRVCAGYVPDYRRVGAADYEIAFSTGPGRPWLIYASAAAGWRCVHCRPTADDGPPDCG